jgi:ADP-heptose:LPS heptosyltransferase
MTHVLVVRLDNDGDVLLTGPAVRAVAATAGRVTLWCGPRGRHAAALLPGVDCVIEQPAAWIDPEPPAVDRVGMLDLIDRLAALKLDQAIVFTSFHQSPLPAALLLRMAGVPMIAAISDDYPGALLNVRHRIDPDVHEVERALSLVATLGYRLPAGDHGRLAVRRPAQGQPNPAGEPGYVVVHPGASVPARAWAHECYAELVDALLAAGWRVVVTGGPHEVALTTAVAGAPRPGVVDLGGRTGLAQLAEVLADAQAVVVSNTGPAHLAAAVQTRVVSLFAPTVPASRWRPWAVPHVLLGDQHIACAGCRATDCPVPGHPCISSVEPATVIAALRRLLADRDRTAPPLAVSLLKEAAL